MKMRTALAMLTAAVTAVGLHAAPASPKIRVFDVQRARSVARWLPPDKNTVALVLTLHGPTALQWEDAREDDFVLSANGQRYPVITRWRSVGNNTPENEAIQTRAFGDLFVAFQVPASVTEFELTYRDNPPIRVKANVRIESVAHTHIDS